MIKEKLAEILISALESANASGELPLETIPAVALEMPKNKAHGDWSTNIALTLAATLELSAIEAAQKIIAHLPVGGPIIASAEIAGPGFINLTLRPDWLYDTVKKIEADDAQFGESQTGAGQKIILEFVSANPNGPITVAHGRNAAIGDAISALLKATGYEVFREHYINDALNSTQMNNFGKSVFYRYRQILGHHDSDDVEDSLDWLYRGDYVSDIAQAIITRDGSKYENNDIDNPETVRIFRDLAQYGMLDEQKADLAAFGVTFDAWFNEATLHQDGRVAASIATLKERGYTYEKDGALWFKTTAFGDDKDRVLLRKDGTATYITGDVAYHKDKFDRGFDRAIDVWGADHAGYIARTKAAVAAIGYDPARLDVLLYQLVRIMKNGEFVKSSKRKGDVLYLKADLIDEIGKDAARFFFLMRSPNTDLDIDLDLAKRTEKDNPVYYVQYAHARIVQTLEKARETYGEYQPTAADAPLSLLTEESEIDLIKKLSDYPDEVRMAAQDYAPQRIAQYARDLAALFHAFYDAGNRNSALRVVADDTETRAARLVLVNVTRIVLKNALTLLGLSAPERM